MKFDKKNYKDNTNFVLLKNIGSCVVDQAAIKDSIDAGIIALIIGFLLVIIFIDLFLAGLSLKLGGKLAKGPYLPQTLEGLGKTTKAVLGKK